MKKINFYNKEKIKKYFLLKYYLFLNRNSDDVLKEFYYKNESEINEFDKYILNKKYNIEQLQLFKSYSDDFTDFVTLFKFKNYVYMDKSSNFLYFKKRILFNGKLISTYMFVFIFSAYLMKDGIIEYFGRNSGFQILIMIFTLLVFYDLFYFIKILLFVKKFNNEVCLNKSNQY